MKSLICIYDSHEKAIESIRLLKTNGFTSKHLSLLGRVSADDEVEGDIKNANTAVKGIGIGAVAGSAIGLLTGVGLLAIPGLGFLVGAGALAGAVAGFDFGVIGGGLISALAIGGVQKEMEAKYQKELESGKSLLIVQGDEEELENAKTILEADGTHMELNLH